jgi:DNA-binding winged helix-turn-helix (wHTH) protein
VLIKAAWPGQAVEDSNLTVQIAAVRRLFEELAGGACWIETLPRRGYRYVGPAVAGGRDPAVDAAPTAMLALPDRPSVAVLPSRT